MELVEGEDLTSLLRRIGRLPFEKAMEITRHLCAGLSALHDQGLVHRDLKPSNVIIDPGGRAKIADFGLAVLDDQSHASEAAGTPAYMSPEQLHGRPATARSDIYALGLVLYELFTGVRLHEARSLEELRRMVDSGRKPGRLSAHLERSVPELDEAISRCLEIDPLDRPLSALAVLALLPGGDPLRAVLEAQQTPSPDLVAASGPRIQLGPWAATSLLIGALACLPVESVIKYVHSVHQAVNLEKSPEVLVDRAKTILRRLGYVKAPWDHVSAGAFRLKEPRQALMAARPDARLGTRAGDTMMRDLLARPHPAGFKLTYIENPTYTAGITDFRDPRPSLDDQPTETIVVSQAGDLLSLHATPVPRPSSLPAAPVVPDREVLTLAGLDPDVFRPGPADFVIPKVSSDTRTSWVGSYAGLPEFPVRAEIARMNGQVVGFELLPEVPPDARPVGSGASPVGGTTVAASRTMYAGMFLLIVAGAIVLAHRQWRSGRGDLRGARRLSAAVFALRMVMWLLRTHHAPTLWAELQPFERGLGDAAANALMAFALYLAAEPVIRKHVPLLIVSWSRLLAGRWRDSLVGRDVLIGLCFASLYKVSELVWKTDWSDPFRLASGLTTVPSYEGMTSVAHATGMTVFMITESILEASVILLGAVVIIKLCRWRPLGIAISTLGLALGSRFFFGSEASLAVNLAALCFAALAMIAALRFGLLALMVSLSAAYVLNMTPTTLDPSDWFFPSFAQTIVLITVAAVLGFRLALWAPSARSSIPIS